MNVMHIISAKTWGGGETAALSMCKTLQRNGYGVYIVLDGNEKVLRTKFADAGFLKLIKMRWGNLWTCIRELRCLVRDNNIKVIHTHTGRVIPIIIIAMIGLPVKIIAYRHNAIKNKKDIIHQLIYKKIDAFVCVSNFVKSCQEFDMPEWMKEKFYVVYNGVTDNLDDHVVLEKKTNRDDFVIGYAGRIVENKGLLYLVKAFEKISDNNSVLKIAGDDSTDYANKIKQYIEERKIDKVEWLGYVKDMKGFYKEIDVMVCPSIVCEAFGLSACEAMYYGVPVISSNNGAQVEIIDDGISGMLVDSGSIDGLVLALEKLKNDYSECIKIGMNGRNKIKTCFTMSKWLENMKNVYADILK